MLRLGLRLVTSLVSTSFLSPWRRHDPGVPRPVDPAIDNDYCNQLGIRVVKLNSERVCQALGQVLGNTTGWFTSFIAALNWVTPGGAAADQITEVQEPVWQPPPKVSDGPFLTIGQSQTAWPGFVGST
jgi:hypothetical protein